MQISPINIQYTQNRPTTNFRGRLTPDIFETSKKMTQELLKHHPYYRKPSPDMVELYRTADRELKRLGVTYLKYGEKEINIGTGQTGFYVLKTNFDLPAERIKIYTANQLLTPRITNGGIGAYMECVNDLKRQDIIMRAMNVETYTMDSSVDDLLEQEIRDCYARFFDLYDFNEKLFYINRKVFYYDKMTKTLYNLDIDLGTKSIMNEPRMKICTFETDSQGNATGFQRRDWDMYALKYKDKTYQEQEAPCRTLPKIAEPENNKLFAEAFRFGNTEKRHKYKAGIVNVLKHLEEKVKVNCPSEDSLRFVQFYDKNKDVHSRIVYYNPITGRSLVYKEDGTYMYQLEYLKDEDGNITACSKFM